MNMIPYTQTRAHTACYFFFVWLQEVLGQESAFLPVEAEDDGEDELNDSMRSAQPVPENYEASESEAN